MAGFVDPRRQEAAREYVATGNASHAARKAGVDRSTVMRWLKDADFQRLVEEVGNPEPSPEALRSLSDLVPKAVEVVEQGLQGDASVSAARIALDVIKVAAQMQPKGSTDGTPPLADLIAQLDAKDKV
jgi:hypothetical protein